MPNYDSKNSEFTDKVLKGILDSKVVDKSSSDENAIKTISDYCKKDLKVEDLDSRKAKVLNKGCIQYLRPKLKNK